MCLQGVPEQGCPPPRNGSFSILLLESTFSKIPPDPLEKFSRNLHSSGFMHEPRTVHLPNCKTLLLILRPCHTQSPPWPGEETRSRARTGRPAGVSVAPCGGKPQLAISFLPSVFRAAGRWAGRHCGRSSSPSTLSSCPP